MCGVSDPREPLLHTSLLVCFEAGVNLTSLHLHFAYGLALSMNSFLLPRRRVQDPQRLALEPPSAAPVPAVKRSALGSPMSETSRIKSQPKRMRMRYTISSEGGGSKPKTVITISRLRREKPESVAKAVSPARKAGVNSQPPRSPESSHGGTVKGSHLHQTVHEDFSEPMGGLSSDSESIYEDAMESFGIVPESPVKNSIKQPNMSWSPKSLGSADTLVDDGLSPWGLPKIMEISDDEDDDDDAITDIEKISEEPEKHATSNYMRLLAKCQQIQYIALLARQRQPKRPPPPKPKDGFFSHFRSWI